MIETNGARDVVCFECRNSIGHNSFVDRTGGGFHHQFSCKKNLPMPSCEPGVSDADMVVKCPGGDVRLGFQIGGYYSHMWFERHPDNKPNSCMDWQIASDGEFSTEDGEAAISFHICDFRQLEHFVAFWGKELRRRGWINDT